MCSIRPPLVGLIYLAVLGCGSPTVHGFLSTSHPTTRFRRYHGQRYGSYEGDNNKEQEISRYEDESGSASRGIVSSLTSLVNSLSAPFAREPARRENGDDEMRCNLDRDSPKSPRELMERIRDDYVERNYLWTGDIDLPSFDEQCRFTDPTLSFTGREQFVKNVQNLRPIVDLLVLKNGGGGCRSDLLDIQLMEDEGYVQSRWNMVGELYALPWRPKIDVIGRTKFWFSSNSSSTTTEADDDGSSFRVYFYDEEWEIPAGKALLQLVTPAGTISNQ